MKRIACIIIEDEPASQDVLKKYISDIPVLELVAVCNNAIEGGNILRSHQIDVMFLDINMPKISGLEFYKSLSNPPLVIFTTAYPEFAVSGFEVSAVDYLVKPFAFDRFVKAVNKLQDVLGKSVGERNGFIMLHSDKKMHKINYADIMYIEAMGDYVKVFCHDTMLMVHTTLQKIQQELPAKLFYRIHKSYVISLQHFNYIEGNTVMIQKYQIPIGQTYRNDFMLLLQQRRY